MTYALSLGLSDYRKNFLEIWDTVTGRFQERKVSQIVWLKTLSQTETVKRLIKILETEEFTRLGIESIFMGEMVNANA